MAAEPSLDASVTKYINKSQMRKYLASEHGLSMSKESYGAIEEIVKKMLDEVKPDAIISACSNCRIHLEDGLEEYNMEIPLLSLTETIAEHLAED